ncbi:MAG: ATP-grasp domain-containing protein [Bacteroidales bacterium]|nr:ATP-grasp domain-containing protein [Bacteroidales bacterium]
MNNILCCNAGRRGRFVQDVRTTLNGSGKVIATDNWSVAPAIFMADVQYVVPKINDPNYINEVLNICQKEDIKAVLTCIDPEIELLAANREKFISKGILPLCPSPKSAHLCFDKYEMYKYLRDNGINTVLTYSNMEEFLSGYEKGDMAFPVFIKPRSGSGSVGAQKIMTMDDLKLKFAEGKYDYIIQEFMNCEDFDADAYIDCISKELIAVFSKKKIETRIGGASKTISFKDEKLFDFVKKIVPLFDFAGAVDMDFFYKDGVYYLSEINPRFGGAYLHAYGAGVDFIQYIVNNINGKANTPEIGNYEEGVLMLMYDDVVITKEKDLLRDFHD